MDLNKFTEKAQETVVGARSPSHYERAWATWLAV